MHFGCVLAVISNLALAARVARKTFAVNVDMKEKMTLFEKWQDFQLEDDDPIRSVVMAADALNMTTETLTLDAFRDGKTRNSYRRSGGWLVKWRNQQRNAAADENNLWSYRQHGADPKHEGGSFVSVDDLASKFVKRFGDSGEVRFTWVLSKDRWILGIAEDVLELGVAHLNLVNSTEEEVLVAGEGCFNCAFFPRQFVINLLSGTFSIQIMKRTDPIAFQQQWVPVVQELWKFAGTPAEVKSVDYSNGMDMTSDELQTSIARAEILRDDGRRNPTAQTKKAFCDNRRPELQWMRYCVCRLIDDKYMSWCDEATACDLGKCDPEERD